MTQEKERKSLAGYEVQADGKSINIELLHPKHEQEKKDGGR